MGFIEILRQYRVGPFAIFDFVTAYLGIFIVAIAISKLFPKINNHIPISSWLWLTLPIGVVVHLVLQINSPLIKMLLDLNGSYLVKVVFLFMLFMGFRGIKFKSVNNATESI